MRTDVAVDVVEGLIEVGGQGIDGGDGAVAGSDFGGAVAAGGTDEFPDRPARLVPDPAADRQGGEDDGGASIEPRVRW